MFDLIVESSSLCRVSKSRAAGGSPRLPGQLPADLLEAQPHALGVDDERDPPPGRGPVESRTEELTMNLSAPTSSAIRC